MDKPKKIRRGFKTRAEYQKWYRETHPEYVKRCREIEKPKLEMYRKATERHRAEKAVKDWLRRGMFTEGWKIEITHLYNGKIETNRKIISNETVFDSHNKILQFEFERMLNEFGINL